MFQACCRRKIKLIYFVAGESLQMGKRAAQSAQFSDDHFVTRPELLEHDLKFGALRSCLADLLLKDWQGCKLLLKVIG